jgi:hypothetical protein
MTLSELLLYYYSLISKHPQHLEPEGWLKIRRTYLDLVRCHCKCSLKQLNDVLSLMQQEGLIDLKPDRWKPRSPYSSDPKDQIERELVLSR